MIDEEPGTWCPPWQEITGLLEKAPSFLKRKQSRQGKYKDVEHFSDDNPGEKVHRLRIRARGHSCAFKRRASRGRASTSPHPGAFFPLGASKAAGKKTANCETRRLAASSLITPHLLQPRFSVSLTWSSVTRNIWFTSLSRSEVCGLVLGSFSISLISSSRSAFCRRICSRSACKLW